MKDLDSLDLFSYQCGVIDAFNEVVKAGVKRIALSHPVSTREEALSFEPCSIFRKNLRTVRKSFLL